MIPRYEEKEISYIWSDENKFSTYLKVELALLESLEKHERIPKGTAEKIKSHARINPERIEEIEKVTRHDVIAFCTSITENIDEDTSKYFHFGCTSSDIIDTATNLQIKDSIAVELRFLKELLNTLKDKAYEYKDVICLGRSHGITAEPMSFGLKFLHAYSMLFRGYEDLKNFYLAEITGQLSGAVGNYTILSTSIEEEALDNLGIKSEPISTQVIARDRISKLFSINANISAAVEKLAHEIRLLHHSDINEVYEGFEKGQKGSSTMPHKKNPIASENISGIGRVLRSHVSPMLENNLLWHERDISHSSAERLLLPDNLGLASYMIKRCHNMVMNLVVNTKRVEHKVLDNFSYLSSYILHLVISKTSESRESIYANVQKSFFESSNIEDLKESLTNTYPELKSEFEDIDISKEFITKIYLSETENIINRVLKSYKV